MNNHNNEECIQKQTMTKFENSEFNETLTYY